MTLGKNILELRRKKNVTQDELAAELGVTAAAVSKWENSYTLPDVMMLCALADYFRVTTDELLGRAPKPFYAAVASLSPTLTNRIEALLKKRGFAVKHKICGSYEEALQIVNQDPTITHLFVSYADPDLEYENSKTGAYIVGAHSDTDEHSLEGFELYLDNMPLFNAMAEKKRQSEAETI